jgi:hypothetical protein
MSRPRHWQLTIRRCCGRDLLFGSAGNDSLNGGYPLSSILSSPGTRPVSTHSRNCGSPSLALSAGIFLRYVRR